MKNTGVLGLVGLVLACVACTTKGGDAVADPVFGSDSNSTEGAPAESGGGKDASVVTPVTPAHDGGALPPSDAGGGSAPDASADGGAPAQAKVPGCGGYAASQIEKEPNDTYATANPVGDVLCGALESGSDVDWFYVDATHGVSLTFDPDDDAHILIRSPSGIITAWQGVDIYDSDESGRFAIQVTSPGKKTQGYLLVR